MACTLLAFWNACKTDHQAKRELEMQPKPNLRRRANLTAVIAAVAAVAMAGAVRADVIFMLGNNPQPGETSILFKAPETGTTINGFVGQSNVDVQFSNNGSGQVLFQNAQGQADIQNNADPGKVSTDHHRNPS